MATSCIAIGAGIGAIASAGAAPSTTASANTASVARHPRARRPVLARAVHGELVLATKHGFVTVTFDRGSLQSAQGQQLTLVEGTKNTTQKTVTVTVPANAVVRNNGKQATLADLKPGERVRVVQGLRRTQVVARTPRTR